MGDFTYDNPFEMHVSEHDPAASFMWTIYNLGLGSCFQDLDELDAMTLIMELEDILYGTKGPGTAIKHIREKRQAKAIKK